MCMTKQKKRVWKRHMVGLLLRDTLDKESLQGQWKDRGPGGGGSKEGPTGAAQRISRAGRPFCPVL